MTRLHSFFCAAVLLGAAAPAWGQAVKLPAEVRGVTGSWIIVAPESLDGGKPRWRIDVGLQEVRLDLLLPPETIDKLKGKVVTAAKPGRYRIEAWNAKGDVASAIATCWVVVGDVPAPPPPDPIPPPNPAPIPYPGFRVLITYETADLAKLPAGQIAALYAREVRDYLNARCSKGPDGKTAEWRLWDRDTDASAESDAWRYAQARAKGKAAVYPWITISDGKTGYEGPLPQTVQETLALLRKWGG